MFKRESTADRYFSIGKTQHTMHDYKAALYSHKRALAIRIKLFGEEHESTADSYRELGVTQHQIQNSSWLHSYQRALDMRIKLLGKENQSTADSYFPTKRLFSLKSRH